MSPVRPASPRGRVKGGPGSLQWIAFFTAGAARAREPHRIAYYLSEIAGLYHPYYKSHRVITEDRALTLARLGLSAAVGQVVRNGLGLLGVSAPERM